MDDVVEVEVDLEVAEETATLTRDIFGIDQDLQSVREAYAAEWMAENGEAAHADDADLHPRYIASL